MKNKKIIIFIMLVIILICSFFIVKINYKKINFGNTISSKSVDSIVNNILNMKSYQADILVKVVSNKNENIYKMKQQNIEEKAYKQIIEEPSELKDIEIVFRDNKLEIKNNKLNLTKLYENYKYISENALILTSFIKDYNSETEKGLRETENEIILEVKIKNELNKYEKYKTLYVDKQTGNPTKLEIKDISQNVRVYILYNEIKINSLQEIV
ncbi:MAG: hypothetical protein IJ223_01380 [Clostridia bacterium]|nr:hypothetical protein [Clostridia bacterium]